MLKVFVPQYDRPTQDNARLANHAFPNSPRYLLLGNSATRAALHALIADQNTTSILILAHGDTDCILAQDGVVALNLSDLKTNVGNVLRLAVFAWACRTSQKLGQEFHRQAIPGGAWWGYRTTVSAPNPRRTQAFQEVLQYIARGFHQVHTKSAAEQFFVGLKDLCTHHYFQVVRSMSISGNFSDAHEIAVGLREAWEHLEVMLPALPQPFDAGTAFNSVLDGV